MGKPTGFLEYKRLTAEDKEPLERIKNFSEFHKHLSKEEQCIQGARCMDCGVPFCQSGMMLGGMASGCPLNNLIPEWNDLLYRNLWESAAERLLKTNPFPEFTSRVCPAPCEAACTCGLNDDPVTVRENEYGLIENAFEEGLIKAEPPTVRTDKKVAVIGSGPAGLAAAERLNKRGHNVTVFERSDRIGGLLMYGIPNMKLDKSVIERRINIMKEEGVIFKTGCSIGKKIKAQDILNEFDAVILACGASSPRDIKAPGRDADGIYFAVDYLKSVTKSLLDSGLEDKKYISPEGKNVVVIGGGDTGNDCVGTSIRLGCKSVTQLEMMPKPPKTRAENNSWPEWPKILKTDYGQQEAIATEGNDPRLFRTTVKEFIKDESGKLKGILAVKLEDGIDENDRPCFREKDGSAFEIPADMVLIAAGFLGCEKYVADSFGTETDAIGNIAARNGSYGTSVKGVFTAGDAHRGQSLVVWALREGTEAAKEADKYLMGYTNL